MDPGEVSVSIGYGRGQDASPGPSLLGRVVVLWETMVEHECEVKRAVTLSSMWGITVAW